MFVFENRNGKGIIRPMFIGRIKNDVIRRTLCALCYPLVVLITVIVNMLIAVIVGVIKVVLVGIKTIKDVEPITKSDIWDNPRQGKW